MSDILTIEERYRILQYAEHDGEVTLTLEEIKKLLDESTKLLGENCHLLASEAVNFNSNNKLRGENKKLVNTLEKQRKVMEWAARIIDSVMYSAEPPRYDPQKWFSEYHELIKEGSHDKVLLPQLDTRRR